MPPGKKFVIYETSHSAPPIRISLIRINPQPIRLPSIIIKLIRAVNQFSCKQNTGIFSQSIANQISYWVLRDIGEP